MKNVLSRQDHQKKKPIVCTQLGALFEDDCISMLGRLRSNVIDCVFADPPFNIGKKYGSKYYDNQTPNEYMEWSHKWMEECIRVLKPGGSLFVYASPNLAIDFASYLKSRLLFRHWIALTMKSGYPIMNKLYPAHYALLYFTKNRPVTFNKLRIPVQTCRHCGKDLKDYGGHRKHLHQEGINLTDFWEDTSPNRHKNTKARPGINELKLLIPERAIAISTLKGHVVLDPFGGGGITYQAAESLQRYWLGSEISTAQAAADRLKNNFRQSLRSNISSKIKMLFKNDRSS